MTTKTERQYSLDDVLTEIRGLGTPPAGDGLRAWLNRYPKFKKDIIAYVTAWVDFETRAEAPESAPEAVDRVVSRTMSRIQQLLDETDQQQPIQDLSTEIIAAGHSYESFQHVLGIDYSILTSLAARLVQHLSPKPKSWQHEKRACVPIPSFSQRSLTRCALALDENVRPRTSEDHPPGNDVAARFFVLAGIAGSVTVDVVVEYVRYEFPFGARLSELLR